MSYDLYYEDAGEGVPILLVPPARSTGSTWAAAESWRGSDA